MDSHSQFSQGGRVTRSQSKPAKPPKLRNTRNTTKPPPRYAESPLQITSLLKRHSPPSLLLERLFAPNRYPDKPRLNIYSKANIIGSIVKSLAGTPELQCLLESQFGRLFHLPVARCLNSVKLVHSLLTLAAFEDEGVVGRMWRKLFETEDLDALRVEAFATARLHLWRTYSLWPQTSAFNGVICRNAGNLKGVISLVVMLPSHLSLLGGPSRHRRGVGKEPELSESGGISEEVKSWFRRELSAQLGALREEIYGWTHPNENASVGVNNQEMSNNDSSREVPTAGLNLLATMGGYFVEEIEEVEETVEGGVEKEAEDVGQSENNSMAMVLYGKPTAYVLPSEVVSSPRNSEDYKTPPEHDILSDLRTPDVAKVGKRHYQTRSAKIQAVEGKSIMTSSNKVEQGRGKRIRKRSTKIGGVYTPDRRLKELFHSCRKPEYTPLAEVDGIFNYYWGYSLKSVLPVLGKTNQLETYLGKRIALMDYSPLSCILSMYPQFEEATDKQKFDWDRVYVPMLWGKDHWVGLVSSCTTSHMTPLLRSLPYILAAYLPPSVWPPPEEGCSFTWDPPGNIYFNERSGDCGPCAVKFLEMHAAGCTYDDMAQITDDIVDIFRKKYTMDMYQEFIGSAEVFNPVCE
ncbi:hypothetical protein Bca52824_016159 [Brassica carinata]|uniref:Ubiquitin-like protease family profile domain-containing protein n=1 Tax=Brassica carinata TaxID=52824 RepID=A0A8X7W4L6_BRACI|nr:hypothetical protein Bca52824_016159 [Brassica carinata]